jgi:serine/threonine protein kinase
LEEPFPCISLDVHNFCHTISTVGTGTAFSVSKVRISGSRDHGLQRVSPQNEYALKMVNESLSATDMAKAQRAHAREVNSFKLIAAAHIAGIPDVYAYGFCPRPWILLEFIPRPFSDVPSHLLPRILSQLIQTLSPVHSLGLVHRDVKPDNLRVSSDCQRLYLLDFGICQRSLTKAENFAGTSDFASIPASLAVEHTPHTTCPLDDIEGVLYTYVSSLSSGNLPWGKAEGNAAIAQHKRSFLTAHQDDPTYSPLIKCVLQAPTTIPYRNLADALAASSGSSSSCCHLSHGVRDV